MQLKQRKHWIFDLDGTLTHPVHDFALIRRELELPPQADILAAIAQAEPDRKRTMIARLDELERHYAAQAKVSEGALLLLELLRSRECRLGILTRNTKELALLSLSAIGAAEYFAAVDVLGRDEIAPKPSPDGINFLLNQWGGESLSGVMVGDFEFDLISGRNAGVFTVHVDPLQRHWPELTDLRCANLTEIIAAIA